MAKLADALASGASDSNIMEVQVLSTAPFLFLKHYMRLWRNWQTRYFEGVVISGRMGSSPINRTILFLRYPGFMARFFSAFFSSEVNVWVFLLFLPCLWYF